eukprot:PhF_6_TR11713/c0_g1_i6/m.19077
MATLKPILTLEERRWAVLLNQQKTALSFLYYALNVLPYEESDIEGGTHSRFVPLDALEDVAPFFPIPLPVEDCMAYNSSPGYYKCPGISTCARANGSLWGTQPLYTDDSSICRAARHAGIIKDGGVFQVTMAPGQSSYTGTSANGITSSSYGSWRGSFSVSAVDDDIPAANCDTVNPCSGISPCTSYRKSITKGQYYECGGGTCGSTRAVWGSGPYTDDSCPCKAARHAGVLPSDGSGGIFFLVPCPGLPSYNGSTAHNITTSSYGSWGGSFMVYKDEEESKGGVGFSRVRASPPSRIAQLVAAPVTGTGGTCSSYSRTTEGCQQLVCTGPSCPLSSGRSTWGSGPYTSDSSPCRAARHAGILPDDGGGGRYYVVNLPGLSSYAGTTANGITTSSYGPWSGSFMVFSDESEARRHLPIHGKSSDKGCVVC